MMVCPTGAIYKRDKDGIVDVNQDICVGCHSCALACPFGAPRYLESGKMSKCHLCVARVERGMEPACVRVCPTKALGSGSMDSLSRQKAEKASMFFLEPLLKISGP
jgi:anaerobic dimethyl sulfoxide reductase subunit B (iron-sulfur subunit)